MLWRIITILAILVSLAGLVFGIFFWEVPDVVLWKLAKIGELTMSSLILLMSSRFYYHAFITNYD